MKLIIDIPEDVLKEMKTKEFISIESLDTAIECIKNGASLDETGRITRILELEKATGKTMVEMLACFASDDEYPPFRCDNCPLRLEDICKPFRSGTDCYTLWLNYLTGKDMNDE